MNLRESLEANDGMPDPLEGREDFLYTSGLVHGFSHATGRRMAISTDGSTMTLHNLTGDTRSAPIWRKGLSTSDEVAFAVKAQLEVIEHWESEGEWGPDPWANDEDPDLRREES